MIEGINELIQLLSQAPAIAILAVVVLAVTGVGYAVARSFSAVMQSASQLSDRILEQQDKLLGQETALTRTISDLVGVVASEAADAASQATARVVQEMQAQIGALESTL